MSCPFKKSARNTFSGNAFCYKDGCNCDWISPNYTKCSTFKKGNTNEEVSVDKGYRPRFIHDS